ncbi:hypothetical protein ACOMHN_006257 [Nucella lapillus]
MPEIKIDGKVLNNVDSFTYLGSSLSSSNSLDKEISNRIAKASASYGRLHKRVWNERGLKLETKCAVYRGVVLTALLYGLCCVLNACLLNHDVGNFLPVGFICLPDAETAAILWYDFGLQSYKNFAISGTITVFAARARQTIACVRGRKRTDICSFINDNDIDILLLTETWLRSAGDEAKCAGLSPPGYSVHSFPRDRLRGPVRGGGIAIIVNNSLKHQVLSCSFSDLDHPSFEAAYIILNINRQRLNLFCVYRPPPSKLNKFTNKDFCDQLTDFLIYCDRSDD